MGASSPPYPLQCLPYTSTIIESRYEYDTAVLPLVVKLLTNVTHCAFSRWANFSISLFDVVGGRAKIQVSTPAEQPFAPRKKPRGPYRAPQKKWRIHYYCTDCCRYPTPHRKTNRQISIAPTTLRATRESGSLATQPLLPPTASTQQASILVLRHYCRATKCTNKRFWRWARRLTLRRCNPQATPVGAAIVVQQYNSIAW